MSNHELFSHTLTGLIIISPICYMILAHTIITNKPLLFKRVTLRDEKPYLITWNVITTHFFTININKLVATDTHEPHNHPYSFIGIILWGRCIEHITATKSRWDSELGIPVSKEEIWNIIHSIGDIFRRTPAIHHKLSLYCSKPCTILTITSGRQRDWKPADKYYTPTQQDLAISEESLHLFI